MLNVESEKLKVESRKWKVLFQMHNGLNDFCVMSEQWFVYVCLNHHLNNIVRTNT